ncbi:MAG: CHAT domain-containing protein [Planctomycetes bacterium]|nr:CHAT domain-containing protein [Planctomycetota bacterium]
MYWLVKLESLLLAGNLLKIDRSRALLLWAMAADSAMRVSQERFGQANSYLAQACFEGAGSQDSEGAMHAELARLAWTRTGNHLAVADVVLTLATGHVLRGRAREAVGLTAGLENAIADPQFAQLTANLLIQRAEAQGQLGSLAEARDSIGAALRILAALPSEDDRAESARCAALGVQGNIEIRQREWQSAAKTFDCLLRLLPPTHPFAHIAKANQGFALAHWGVPVRGHALLCEATAALAPWPQTASDATYHRGLAAALAGDAMDLADCSKELLALAYLAGKSASRLIQRGHYLAGLHGMATGAPSLALDSFRSSIESCDGVDPGRGFEAEALAREQWNELHALAVDAAAKVGTPEHLLEILESGRARALFGLLQSAEGDDSETEEVRAANLRLDEARVELERTYLRVVEASNTRAQKRAHLKAFQEAQGSFVLRHDAHLKAIEAQRVRAQTARITLRQIQGRLASHQGVVTYGRTSTNVVALVISASETRIVDLGTFTEIEPRLTRINRIQLRPEARGDIGKRQDVTTQNSSEPSSDAELVSGIADLASMLWKPLGLDPRIRRVVVSPDPSLSLVPFSSLDSERVIECATSLSVSEHQAKVRDKRTAGNLRSQAILAFGNPHRPLLPNLSSAEIEARAIAGAAGRDTCHIGKAANEASFRTAIKLPWRAVHFACHAEADTEKPLQGSLKLANADELLVGEVLDLRLTSDLVVLSACDTARGKTYEAEGVVAFPSAFFIAGATQVLVSLWPVDDEATQELMVRFYAEWNAADPIKRVDAAMALHRAQQQVRAQKRWQDPYFWAAWQLWGPSELESPTTEKATEQKK